MRNKILAAGLCVYNYSLKLRRIKNVDNIELILNTNV